MSKIGRSVRNEAKGVYRLQRNGAKCEVIKRSTGRVEFEGTYIECNEWIERNGHDAWE